MAVPATSRSLRDWKTAAARKRELKYSVPISGCKAGHAREAGRTSPATAPQGNGVRRSERRAVVEKKPRRSGAFFEVSFLRWGSLLGAVALWGRAA